MPATASTSTTMESPASHAPPERAMKSVFSSLPSHISPALDPLPPPHAQPDSLDLHDPPRSDPHAHSHDDEFSRPPPASLISPAFTPPQTPGTQTPATRAARSVPVDSRASTAPRPQLLRELPRVACVVRARIPTTSAGGAEVWLHVYENDCDDKEHLAIVFGSNIRSASLDAARPGETEMDRMVRGAYTGRLWPGRTKSRVEDVEAKADARGGALRDAHGTDVRNGERVDRAGAGEDETEKRLKQWLPLVRVHSECYTGETVRSARCDCGEQLDEAARLMSMSGDGVVVYLRQEGRGIGLAQKLAAYNLQDLGNDTYEANLLLNHPADARSYGLATAILVDLGLGGERGIKLLTNNPDKVFAIEGPNREVVVRERVAMVPLAWKTGGKSGIKSEELEKYLSTKIEKFKHMIG